MHPRSQREDPAGVDGICTYFVCTGGTVRAVLYCGCAQWPLRLPHLHQSWIGSHTDGPGKAMRWALLVRCKFRGNSFRHFFPPFFFSVQCYYISAELTEIESGPRIPCSFTRLKISKGPPRTFLGHHFVAQNGQYDVCVDKKTSYYLTVV